MAEALDPNLPTAHFDLDPDDDSLAASDESVDELAPPVDAGEMFAEVLSGAYDAEPVVDGAAAVAERRVLAAEIDAPKLQKVLAQAGIGSRRDMEQLIVDGQITVNGQAAHIGQRIAFGDQIKVAGRPIKYRIAPPQTRVLAYHKPVGEVVTNDDPQNRPTVFRKLPRLANGKWQSIGRLDINTEGLLLFTNSGDLANQLMHPRFGVEREYAVRVLGTLEDDARQRLISGVEIASVPASFRSIEDGGGEGVNRWYRVVITEGRNREVRKLFDAVGLTVNRLIRIRYGCVVLPRGLKRGVWIDLEDRDVRALRQIAGLREPQARSANVEEVARPIRPQRGPRDRGGKRGPERGPERNAERNAERPGVVERGPDRSVDRGPQRHVARGADRGPGAGADRGPGTGPDRGPAADRGPDRGPRQERGPGPDRSTDRRDPGPRREPGEGGPIPNPLQQTYDRRAIREARAPRREFPEDGPIPNPLEQTYDKRFVQKPNGPGGRKGEGNNQGQPDPMQTSMGYIGADTFYRKMDGGGGGGRSGGGGGGGRRRGR
jgi:23S rRNA pseudouridine2605 synthase